MPFPIDGGGFIPPVSNDLVQSVGFSRSQALQQGPSALGTGEEFRQTDFGSVLSDAIYNMENRQRKADELGVAAVTGRLANVHDYTIAAAEAKLTMELASTLRNKAVDAFNEVMRMQA